MCNLCNNEKLFILKAKKNIILNKRTEIFSNCRHQRTAKFCPEKFEAGAEHEGRL